MTISAGTFEVKLLPQSTVHGADETLLGRMSIEKTYRGDLEGSAIGEMLSALTDTKGSAGYVAVERVTGTLHGRQGTFVLQHSGTMTRGAQQLVVNVVPDSGTDGLRGLRGTMKIMITEGKHSYELEYEIDGPD